MIDKVTIFSCLIISTTCMIVNQAPIQFPILIPLRIQEVPNYSFSYNVNEHSTGDIKSQEERQLDGVTTGQYSLIQPDGVRRVVNYRADDLSGFKATVANDRDNLPQEEARHSIPQRGPVEEVSQAPMAISRSSIIQTIYNRRRNMHPWN